MCTCRWVGSNEGLCGDLVSVGSVGTSYGCDDSSPDCGISNTNLGNACQSALLSSSNTAMMDPPDSDSSSSDPAVVAGAVAGGVLAGLAVIGSSYFLRMRMRVLRLG